MVTSLLTQNIIRQFQLTKMNKERYNQIIDEAYNYYLQNWEPNREIEEIEDPYGLIRGTNFINDRPLDKDMFIFCIKKDPEFSEKWGLKIEERELNLDDRAKLHPNPENFYDIHGTFSISDNIEDSNFPDKDWLHEQFDNGGIPTKLITLTYNNEKIGSHE